jgi:hypothetical protein
MNPNTATEYRNLPLNVLTESTTNPRRIFEDAALKELAESIRVQGVLSPLLVRPLTGQSFEIVAGARRYRAAQIAEAATVPVRIVNLTDAEAMEAALIENLQRRDVHPLEEAQGFHALLNLEEPKYTIVDRLNLQLQLSSEKRLSVRSAVCTISILHGHSATASVQELRPSALRSELAYRALRVLDSSPLAGSGSLSKNFFSWQRGYAATWEQRTFESVTEHSLR